MLDKTLRSAFLSTISVITALLLSSSAIAAMDEVLYAEALLAFHQSNFVQALKILDAVLSETPDFTQALELKALTQKGKGDLEGAALTYKKLAASTKAPGSYQFEQGVILVRQRRFAEGRKLLQQALRARFNPEASHFFLGNIDFELKDWDSAETHFRIVLGSRVNELKGPSYIFLGQIASQRNDWTESVRSFTKAREIASIQMESESLRESSEAVLRNVDKVLAPINQGRVTAMIGVVNAYDSNVLLNPSITTASTPSASQGSSFKETLQFSLSYGTRPLDRFVFTTSYAGSANYNFKSTTRTSQFFTNDLTLTLTRDLFEPLSWGFKAEGIGVLRYMSDPTSGSNKYRAYSLVGSFGPYLRYELAPKWVLGMDVFFQPTKYFIDPERQTEFQESGNEEAARIFIKEERHRVLWNPGATVSGFLRRTAGTEFRGKGYQVELNNTAHFSEKLTMQMAAALILTSYPDRADGRRNDTAESVSANLAFKLSRNFNTFLDAYYINNHSNVVESYKYSRWVASLGFNVVF